MLFAKLISSSIEVTEELVHVVHVNVGAVDQ